MKPGIEAGFAASANTRDLARLAIMPLKKKPAAWRRPAGTIVIETFGRR
jgi:hypothetical protein